MRTRIITIALALVAVGIAFVISRDGAQPASPAAPPTAQAAAHRIRVSLVYSPEKEKLLAPLIDRFNAQRHPSGDRVVYVDARVVASGDVTTRVAKGTLRPVLWSPASSFWGRLLNFKTDQSLVRDDNPSIVQTPLVIAMWKELADAYGYPRRPLGFAELDKLSTRGWAAIGKAQYGAFKYVHTNPDLSTSGLSAVAASYYAAAGKREGLTAADVTKARHRVRGLERSIVHYGNTTLFIAQQMRQGGL